jgi:Relaxase/Mobilisation nuclease domain
MVARIVPTGNLSAILNYNEKKVTQNNAELIHSSGFLQDTDRMNFYDKAERFQRLNELRPRTEVNMLHISLNFDPSENLTTQQLAAIADRYMDGIGFKGQPYLVYKHNDAGHPHIHIITNIIQADGERIDPHNLGKKKSEPTRKAIENEFGLVRAEDSRHQKKIFELQPVDAQKVIYGNATETKKAMKEAIREVYQQYKFTSLAEFNAALRQFNVTADPGTKESRTFKYGGLTYRVLDEQGNKVGVPIKASSFYFKPTLANLEEKYKKNEEARQKHLGSIGDRIDVALAQKPAWLGEFTDRLKAAQIEIVIRQNEQGRVYGLTYVDKQTKTVINGSDLGKQYSANNILRQFDQSTQQAQQPPKQQQSRTSPEGQKQITLPPREDPFLPRAPGFNPKVPQLLSTLMEYTRTGGHQPRELEEEESQRRKRRMGSI